MSIRQAKRKKRLALWGGGLVLGLIGLGSMPLAGAVLILVSLVMLSRRSGVPVLVYHSVSEDAGWLPWAANISVRPEVFAAHMAHLAKSRWQVVSSQDVFAGRTNKHSVALHFDDAYLDFLNAAPVLRKHGFAATVFASSDFIDPSQGQRDATRAARGYLNVDELRALNAEQLFEVACHGKDHARVAVSPRTTPRDPNVWGAETAYLWSLMPGNKARWFDQKPPEVREVPDNDSALCANIVTGDTIETDAARDVRVTKALAEAQTLVSQAVRRDVTFLCWPFDRVTPSAEASARAAGFTHWTGGHDNTAFGKATHIVSRTHINDYGAGGGPLWVEVLVFRARLKVASGNLLWLPVTLAAKLLRRRKYAFLHGPQAAKGAQ